jgi:Rrf2 family protein
MFRVSRRVDYGLRLLIALAAEQEAGSQATSRLAEKLDIPLAFLHQIGRSLIQANILRSSPGPGGGLRLNQAPDKVTLLQVLEVLDGPVRLSACLEQSGSNGHSTMNPSAQAWSTIQENLIHQLREIRLSMLAQQAVEQEKGFYPVPGYAAQNSAIPA